ncbi:hypothetical protein MTO96_043621 [Rhipicephalus appendiculatus]
MAALPVPATFAVKFAYLKAAYDQRRRLIRRLGTRLTCQTMFFWRHVRLSKETVWWLCDEVADELGGARPTALSVERQVLCALRFFATGSFQSSVGSEETISVTQPAVSKCVRRVAPTIVNAGTSNKWLHLSRTPEKAAVKEGFIRLGPLPGVIGCVDGSFVAIVAPRGSKQKAAFFCRKGYYALNVMFICDGDMRILAVDPLRPGSDHDSHIWGTTRLHERFADGRIDTTDEYLLGTPCASEGTLVDDIRPGDDTQMLVSGDGENDERAAPEECQGCRRSKEALLEMEVKLGNQQREIARLEKNMQLEKKLDLVHSQLLTLSLIKSSPKECAFYTGFPNYEVFETMLDYLTPTASTILYWGWEKMNLKLVAGLKKLI